MNLLLILILESAVVSRTFNLAPPMGWNSWNHYKCEINESLIKQTADLIVSSGLRDAGYVYLNLDDCWASKDRIGGRLVGDLTKFPSGMRSLGEYIHARGLKFGIYSDGGTFTCAGFPGSGGYEEIDALTFASWGVDYLKYDNCFTNPLSSAEARYTRMKDAIELTGRTIFYSICNWGQEEVWKWGPGVGDSWRISGDIGDLWRIKTLGERIACPCIGNFCPKIIIAGGHDCSVLNILDKIAGITGFTSQRGFNDPDMLEIGNGGMNVEELKSHFSFWAALKSPLLIGANLIDLTETSRLILTNKDLISINQDSRRQSISRKYKGNFWQIWTGLLSDESTILLILNESDESRLADFSFASMGMRANMYNTKDVWSGEMLVRADKMHDLIAAHATLVLQFSTYLRPGPE